MMAAAAATAPGQDDAVSQNACAQSAPDSNNGANNIPPGEGAHEAHKSLTLRQRNKKFWGHLTGLYKIRQKWKDPVEKVKERVEQFGLKPGHESSHEPPEAICQKLDFSNIGDFDEQVNELLKLAEIFKGTLDRIALDVFDKVLETRPNLFIQRDNMSADSSRQKTYYSGCSIKTRTRAKDKARDIYEKDVRYLLDVARFTIVVPVHHDGEEDKLKKLMEFFQSGKPKDNGLADNFKVVHFRNGFLEPMYTNYADANYILEIRLSENDKNALKQEDKYLIERHGDSFLTEVQVHVEEIFKLKDESHDHYVYFQKYFFRDDSSVRKMVKAIEPIGNCSNLSKHMNGEDVLKDYAEIVSAVMDMHEAEPLLRSLDELLDLMCEYDMRTKVLSRLIDIIQSKQCLSYEDLACFQNLAELLATQASLVIHIRAFTTFIIRVTTTKPNSITMPLAICLRRNTKILLTYTYNYNSHAWRVVSPICKDNGCGND